MGAYLALATIGVRRLEAQWASATELRESLEDYVRSRQRGVRIGELRVIPPPGRDEQAAQAARDYRERIAQLRRRASDVVAVDPGVRRLRREVVTVLRRLEESAPGIVDGARSHDDGAVVRMLDEQRERWRLRTGTPPKARPLDLPRRIEPLSPIPTGDRLVLELEEDLVEVDLDRGEGRVIDGSEVYDMAVVGRRVVWVDDDEAKVVPLGTTEAPRSLGPAVEVLSAGDGRTVWAVVERDEDSGEATVATIDVESGSRGPGFTVIGELSAAWGRRVAVTHEGDVRPTVEVWDADRRAVVRRVPGATALDLHGDTLLWHDDDDRVHLTNVVDGRRRSLASPGDAFPAHGAFSPDGRTAAVLWADTASVGTLSLFDVANQGRAPVSHPLRSGADPAWAAWSPDGKRLYVVSDSFAEELESTVTVYDLEARRLEALRLVASIYELAAF